MLDEFDRIAFRKEIYGSIAELQADLDGTVRNFVRGAIFAPMEGEYGDQEGHAGRSFGGPRPEGCVFEGRAFR